MARYIDADEILKHQRKIRGFDISPENDFWDYAVLIEDIQNAPTADVAEVKHGEWKAIVKQDNYFEPPYCDTCKCSVCGYVIDVSETVYNYCPMCGAKMDGERSETK